MKTLRFIGMAILAITLNGTFTACSSDDDWIPENEYDIVVGDLAFTLTTEGAILTEANTGLKGHVDIPEGVYYEATATTYPVIEIGDIVFQDCRSLTSVTIPNSVTTIGAAAFALCCSLTSVTIPNSVTTIGTAAFSNCTSLTSVTIPNSVTTIGTTVFQSCSSLTSVTIPNSVTMIGYAAFEACRSLTSVTIPNSVTTIDEYAFQSCTSLTSITIPSSVTSIGMRAFSSCNDLSSVHCRAAEPPSISTNTFSIMRNLYVPVGSLAAYEKHNVWKNFSNIMEED